MDSADDVVAVIAGRLAVRMVFQGLDTARIATLSVELARAICAEVERTRPVAEFKGTGPAAPASTPTPGRLYYDVADLVERTANGQQGRGFYLAGYAHLVMQEWQAVAAALRIKAGSGTYEWARGQTVIVNGDGRSERMERDRGAWRYTDQHGDVWRLCATRDRVRPLSIDRERDPQEEPPISWGDQREKS